MRHPARDGIKVGSRTGAPTIGEGSLNPHGFCRGHKSLFRGHDRLREMRMVSLDFSTVWAVIKKEPPRLHSDYSAVANRHGI